MADKKPTADDVWNEHVEAVHVGAHAAYMIGVLAGSFLLMVLLIAALGAGAS